MKKLLALLTVLFIPVSAFCSTGLSTTQVQSLKEISTKIAIVHELAERKVITATEEAAADSLYCQDAKQVVGRAVTPQEIQVLVANGEKTEGLGTFWNFAIVIAGILFLLGVVGLIGYYLKDVLAEIPPVVYEFFAYVGAAFLSLWGSLANPFHLGVVTVEPLWFAIPGALGLAGCISLTYGLHFKSSGRSRDTVKMGPGFINYPTVMFGLCTAAWASMAVFYHNIFPDAGIPHILAFGAVIALQAFLGFSVLTMPGCIALGWERDRQVPKSAFSSFIILLAYVVLKLKNLLTGDLSLFAPGAIFMGAFVFYLALLVMSNKWYCWSKHRGSSGEKKGLSDGSRYLLLQIACVAFFAAAIYFGSALHLGALLGVGGTFFAIYLLEKYYEIPWKGVGWAWSVLGVAVFLYFLVGFASTHSQYFVWGIR